MRSQAIGLAERVGIDFEERIVHLRAPWRWLPGHRVPWAFMGLAADSDPLEPPWPDLLITCGRRSVALSMAIRRASGGRTFTVHIQDPRVPPACFDLVVAPRHDCLAGGNVEQTLGALHRVTPEKLAAEADRFRATFADLPRPLVAAVIGGNSKAYRLTADIAREIAAQLKTLAGQGCGLVLTFSRRTGAENEAIIREALAGSGVWIDDRRGDNPYLGMLGLADYILVTADSASMVTEATASGRPVMTLDLAGGSTKFERFHAQMRDAGLVRPFRGALQDWSYPPLDETGRIAAMVRGLLVDRAR